MSQPEKCETFVLQQLPSGDFEHSNEIVLCGRTEFIKIIDYINVLREETETEIQITIGKSYWQFTHVAIPIRVEILLLWINTQKIVCPVASMV